jgi:hypothetical protein
MTSQSVSVEEVIVKVQVPVVDTTETAVILKPILHQKKTKPGMSLVNPSSRKRGLSKMVNKINEEEDGELQEKSESKRKQELEMKLIKERSKPKKKSLL